VANAAQRGYALVEQDLRGRFQSEGHHAIIFGNDRLGEHQDGPDTLEWIARQPWCSGWARTTPSARRRRSITTSWATRPTRKPRVIIGSVAEVFGPSTVTLPLGLSNRYGHTPGLGRMFDELVCLCNVA
jgi:hypothetical protein